MKTAVYNTFPYYPGAWHWYRHCHRELHGVPGTVHPVLPHGHHRGQLRYEHDGQDSLSHQDMSQVPLLLLLFVQLCLVSVEPCQLTLSPIWTCKLCLIAGSLGDSCLTASEKHCHWKYREDSPSSWLLSSRLSVGQPAC